MNKIQLSFLSWLAIPILLTYISVNYLLNNIIEPRWDIKVSADNQTKATREIPAPSPIPEFNWNNEGLVTFWFDDAWLSQYETALPILKEAGYKGAIAVPTELIGYDNYMNWYQLRRAQHLGWEINSHSERHNCYVDSLSEFEIRNEVIGSLEDLKREGLQHDIYVLPCGAQNKNVINLIKQNYKYMRTVEPGINKLPVKNKYALEIIEVNKFSTLDDVKNSLLQTRLNKGWILLTFHQVSDEDSPFAITPEFFKQVVEEVKKSNLEVVLPSQALKL